MQDVVNAIRAWRPGQHSREIQYRDDLLAYLKKYFTHSYGGFMSFGAPPKLYKEYGQGRVDILVKASGEEKVGIELKLAGKLASKASINRLAGQLRDMIREDGITEIIVLVLGELDPHYESMLRDVVSEFRNPFNTVSVFILKKRVSVSGKTSGKRKKTSRNHSQKTQKKKKMSKKRAKRARGSPQPRSIFDVFPPF